VKHESLACLIEYGTAGEKIFGNPHHSLHLIRLQVEYKHPRTLLTNQILTKIISIQELLLLPMLLFLLLIFLLIFLYLFFRLFLIPWILISSNLSHLRHKYNLRLIFIPLDASEDHIVVEFA